MALRGRVAPRLMIALVVSTLPANHLVRPAEVKQVSETINAITKSLEVELNEVVNELARLAKCKGCARLQGIYLPTAKNEMVRDHYPRMGFQTRTVTPDQGEYVLELGSFHPRSTKIKPRSRS